MRHNFPKNILLQAADATLKLWKKHGLGDDDNESEPVYHQLERAVRQARAERFAVELLDQLEEMTNMFEGFARVKLRDKYVQSEQEKAARDLIARAKGEGTESATR